MYRAVKLLKQPLKIDLGLEGIKTLEDSLFSGLVFSASHISNNDHFLT